MLKKLLFLLNVVLSISFNDSYSENITIFQSDSITESQATQKAIQLNSGTVMKTELTRHNGIKVWEVYMVTSSGGELKVKYRVDNGTMVELKGTSPSFEYEVKPGMNLIDYSTARSVALNTKTGDIKEWKLEKDESDNRWEYRFLIRNFGQKYEIRIDAATGVVLRIK
jgi:uncharacterized membrane protein YkoI